MMDKWIHLQTPGGFVALYWNLLNNSKTTTYIEKHDNHVAYMYGLSVGWMFIGIVIYRPAPPQKEVG